MDRRVVVADTDALSKLAASGQLDILLSTADAVHVTYTVQQELIQGAAKPQASGARTVLQWISRLRDTKVFVVDEHLLPNLSPNGGEQSMVDYVDSQRRNGVNEIYEIVTDNKRDVVRPKDDFGNVNPLYNRKDTFLTTEYVQGAMVSGFFSPQDTIHVLMYLYGSAAATPRTSTFLPRGIVAIKDADGILVGVADINVGGESWVQAFPGPRVPIDLKDRFNIQNGQVIINPDMGSGKRSDIDVNNLIKFSHFDDNSQTYIAIGPETAFGGRPILIPFIKETTVKAENSIIYVPDTGKIKIEGSDNKIVLVDDSSSRLTFAGSRGLITGVTKSNIVDATGIGANFSVEGESGTLNILNKDQTINISGSAFKLNTSSGLSNIKLYAVDSFTNLGSGSQIAVFGAKNVINLGSNTNSYVRLDGQGTVLDNTGSNRTDLIGRGTIATVGGTNGFIGLLNNNQILNTSDPNAKINTGAGLENLSIYSNGAYTWLGSGSRVNSYGDRNTFNMGSSTNSYIGGFGKDLVFLDNTGTNSINLGGDYTTATVYGNGYVGFVGNHQKANLATAGATYALASNVTDIDITFNDKSRKVITQDVNKNQNWSRIEDLYSPAADKISTVYNNDDNSRITFFFDPTNVENWKIREIQYDPNGRENVEIRTYDDNRKDITYKDAANQQPWTQIVDQFDKDGNKFKQTTLNDDTLRYVNFYDVYNQNPWKQVTNVFNKDGLQLSRTDYLDNNDRLVVMFDPANLNPWSRLEEQYDPSNRHKVTIQTNDDGSKFITYKDAASQQAWSVLRDDFDKDGNKIKQTTNNDDGTLIEDWNDVYSQNPWTRAVLVSDKDGRPLSRTDYLDNNDRIFTRFDPANLNPWSRLEEQYDQSNRHKVTIQINDDNSKLITYKDAAGQLPWIQQLDQFDKNGNRIKQTTWNDDTTLTEDHYDVYSQNPWTRAVLVSDKDGRPLSRTDYLDNNDRIFTRFDPTNLEPWNRLEEQYDPSNRNKVTIQTNDDNSKFITYKDAAGQLPWTQRLDQFDKDGNRTKQTTWNDDGTRNVDFYDVYNKNPWKQVTNIFNKDGLQISRIDLLDNNDRLAFTYDAGNQNDTKVIEQQYDPFGRQRVEIRTFDDERKHITYYDYLSQEGWIKYVNEFDKNGSRLKQVFYDDNSARREFSYDPYNQNGWVSIVDGYDSNGTLISKTINNDDNSRNVFNYDQYNINTWSETETQYDRNNKQIVQIINNDDSSKDINYQDRYNINNWDWYGDHVVDNKRLSQTVFYDDNHRDVNTYDMNNNFDWNITAESYDGSGKRNTRHTFSDNGDFKVERWTTQYGGQYANTPNKIEYWSADKNLIRFQELNYNYTSGTNSRPMLGRVDTYDMANLHQWRVVSHFFASDGSLTASSHARDDPKDQFAYPSTPQDYYTNRWNFGVSVSNNEVYTYNAQVYKSGSNILNYYNSGIIDTWKMPLFANQTSKELYASNNISYGNYSSYNPIDRFSGKDYVLYKGYDISRELADAQREISGYALDNIWLKPQFSGSKFEEFSTYSLGKRWEPVVIDLDGDGIEIDLLKSSKAKFDVDGSQKMQHTSWVGKDDGLLVIDLPSEGSQIADNIINQTKEVRFTAWNESETDEVASDLEALRKHFDSNEDGILSELDAYFNNFRIWHDIDGDGMSRPSEISSLADLGIDSISLVSDSQKILLEDGSIINGSSLYHQKDGHSGMIADVAFVTGQDDLNSNAGIWQQTVSKKSDGSYDVDTFNSAFIDYVYKETPDLNSFIPADIPTVGSQTTYYDIIAPHH